jgi:hypothetical protein
VSSPGLRKADLFRYQLEIPHQAGVVVHICNLSTWETEAAISKYIKNHEFTLKNKRSNSLIISAGSVFSKNLSSVEASH